MKANRVFKKLALSAFAAFAVLAAARGATVTLVTPDTASGAGTFPPETDLTGKIVVCDRGDRYLSTGVFPA